MVAVGKAEIGEYVPFPPYLSPASRKITSASSWHAMAFSKNCRLE